MMVIEVTELLSWGIFVLSSGQRKARIDVFVDPLSQHGVQEALTLTFKRFSPTCAAFVRRFGILAPLVELGRSRSFCVKQTSSKRKAVSAT